MDPARITEILTDPVTLDLVEQQPITQIAYAAADGSPRDLIFGLAESAGFRNHDGALNLLRGRIEKNRRAAGNKEENRAQMPNGPDLAFTFPNSEIFLRVKCDVHLWMFTYVCVVDHPYFAVSDESGAFTIAGVPAGNHTIQVWHERYGSKSERVTVKSGETTTVEFAYAGTEKPSAPSGFALQDLASQ